ncbi:hypothetical protein, partial [uncultured Jatrophihabitans sp.]|uniref:hypothetical protein n=1 Tax=uncultured Jatrophihabitans sp. TaxID=1610747 RepID=UPI0035CC083E
VWAASRIMVRRFVQPVAPSPGPAHPPWPFSAHNTVDYLGSVHNPSDHVHGGLVGVDSTAVIAAVWALKQKLHHLVGGMDMTTKEWSTGMDEALVRYRKKYRFGQTNWLTVSSVGYNHILNQK